MKGFVLVRVGSYEEIIIRIKIEEGRKVPYMGKVFVARENI